MSSERGKLPGLMQYRYQKRNEEKLKSSQANSTNMTMAPVMRNSIGQTASMSQSSDSNSPVFNGNRPVMNIATNRTSPESQWIKTSAWNNQNSSSCSSSQQLSGSTHISQTSSNSSQTSYQGHPILPPDQMKSHQSHSNSPHQSRGAFHQSHIKSNQDNVGTPQGDAGSGHSTSLEDREILIHVASLASMFPNKHKDEMIQALRAASNNMDTAVDFLIDNKFAEYTIMANKRKAEGSDMQSPISSPLKPPPVKRARKLSSDDDDVEVIGFTESPHLSLPVKSPLQLQNERIQMLQEKFPNLPRKMITNTLAEQGNDLNRAGDILTEICSKHVSQTENVGSIKAIKQARVIAQATGHHSHNSQANVSNVQVTDLTSPSHVTNGHSTCISPQNQRRSSIPETVELIADDEDEDWDNDAATSDEEEDIYHGQQGKILRFVNEAALSDLLCVDGCSKKKAEYILTIRPFQSWDDMAQQFHDSKLLSVQLLAECKEVLRIRNVIENLMLKCERISKELETIVSSLRDKTSLEESNTDYISEQPTILTHNMRLTPYQLVGLNWLAVMHEQELNGILGDEMGLGKTIQTIAFLAYMKEQNIDGPHLVIAPSSTLDNWLRELQTWCPSLRVMMYYGSQEERADIRHQVISGTYEDFDVAVTTYNMATGSVEDRSLFKKFSWHYAIFDEGHMLKNMSSMRYKSLTKIRAHRRLLLTGTPLQNNLIELMSLLAFVMPDMFTSKTEHLKKIFSSMTGKSGDENRSAYEMENIGHAKQILKPFFLRRLKSEVLQQLPKKQEVVQRVPLTEEQQQQYDDLKQQFNKTVREQSFDGMKGMAMLMQLRKSANHPLLLRHHYNLVTLRLMAKDMLKEPTHYESVEQYVFDDMEVMSDFELHNLCKQYKSLHKYKLNEDLLVKSGKMVFLDELLPKLKEEEARVLLFSQFTMVLDILEVYMNKRGYHFLRLDGQTPVAERQELIDRFNRDKEVFIFLLSTRAGGMGINLTAANTVIVHDIDFNPYNDKQAEDRCHRLGQTRDVTVYKLLTTNTMEEGMYQVNKTKLRLEQDVTGSKKGDEPDKKDVASLLKRALDIEN